MVLRNRSASASISARALEDVGDLLRQPAQRLDELPPLQDAQVPQPGEPERHQRERGHLAGERLGARDADLGAGVQVDAAVHLARDRRAHHVHQAERPGAAALRLAHRRQRVGGLAGLGDDDDQRPAVDHRVAVAELRGVLDLDRDPGHLLEHVLADERRVPGRAAGGDDDALDLLELVVAQVEAADARRCPRRRAGGRGACCRGSPAARRSP